MLIKCFFAVKMMIKCAFCQLSGFADIIDRHGLVTVFVKKTGGGIKQFVTAVLSLNLAFGELGHGNSFKVFA